MEAYLDNSATTAVCEAAARAIAKACAELYGNPSSVHEKGIAAEEMLKEARKNIAKALGVSAEEVYFTAGGTEAANLAVLGAARAAKHRGNKIVTTAFEHPCVAKCVDRLEAEGFTVVRLPVEANGKISAAAFEEAIDEKTALVSAMAVNNEIGSIQPISEIREIIRRKNSPAVFHCDSVQAFGKIDMRPVTAAADLVSVSSHKIHGPKGAGALYVKKGTKLDPVIFGGGQENNIRPGTEPMPAIAGFGAAAKELGNPAEGLKKATELRNYFEERAKEVEGLIINSPADALPYIINISMPGYRSEPMINLLSDSGIYVSGGSACSKGKRSPVLTALGLDSARIDGALRVSMSRFTEREHIDMLIDGLNLCRKILRRSGK